MTHIAIRFLNSNFTIVALLLATLFATANPANAQRAPSVRAIEFEVRTGGDNLRGGNDNAFVAALCGDDMIGRGVVHVRCGGVLRLNAQRQELKDYTQAWRTIELPPRRSLADIRQIVLFVEGFGGGFNGDNWNVDMLRVTAIMENGRRIPLFEETGLRFTGNNRKFVRRIH